MVGSFRSRAALFFIPFNIDRGALLRLRRLRGVELPVAQFDAPSSIVPGNDAADMVVRHFECNGD
jgi:hypothetical protein